MADRLDGVVTESVNEVVAKISESLHGRMTNLEAKMQSQWEIFEKNKKSVETYTVFRPRFLSRVVLSQFLPPVIDVQLVSAVFVFYSSHPVCCL